VTALCWRFGFSRKTGYKWLKRYRLEGIEGLSERSRAPCAHPQAVGAAIAERCLAVRRAHPTWGPVKVRSWLERNDPEGVRPERIAPGRPQQNGRLERLHLTLLRDIANPPARSLREQLGRFRDFQRVYNEERPHAALGNTPPVAYYARSPRHWDGVLREPEYPASASVRRVHRNGAIRWRGAEIYLSETLVGEPVGLSERQDGSWLVHYGPIELGRHRPSRRPPGQAQAYSLWICG